MVGAVYSSLPMPQLKHARLKLSDARPFAASVLDSVPVSSFSTQMPFSLSQMDTTQLAFSLEWCLCQFMGPTVSSRMFWSHRASLYSRSESQLPSFLSI